MKGNKIEIEDDEIEDYRINVEKVKRVLEIVFKIVYKLLKVLFQGVTFTVDKLWEAFNENKSAENRN